MLIHLQYTVPVCTLSPHLTPTSPHVTSSHPLPLLLHHVTSAEADLNKLIKKTGSDGKTMEFEQFYEVLSGDYPAFLCPIVCEYHVESHRIASHRIASYCIVVCRLSCTPLGPSSNVVVRITEPPYH